MPGNPDPRDVSTLDRPDGAPLSTRETATLALDDRYAVGEVLGEGGMGIVRLSEDRRTGRHVALKVLRRAGAPDGEVARFVREVRVQAELDHPGVVPVYDVGGVRGSTYFTMRRVQGMTLDEIIGRLRSGDEETQRKHTRHRLLTAFVQICGTVEYAHARGIIHRDLKPANVMFGDFGEVYVLDWGLAQVEPREESARAMGTPAYMAPEQVAGGAIDARADIFALGAILFEILTLEPLLDEAAVNARLEGKRPVFDPRPSRVRSAGVPHELDAICAEASAIDVTERLASVGELRDAVEAFLAQDRHGARRQELASRHLARARAAAAKTDDPDCRARMVALQELGRALALSPEDAEARAFLAHLLMTPPKNAPPEVEEDWENTSLRRRRSLQWRALLTYTVPWITLYPLFVWLAGARRPIEAALPALAWCVFALTTLVCRALRADDHRINYSAVAALIAVATTTLLTGPYLVVPVLAGVTVMGNVLVGSKRQRPLVVVLGCAALVVPTLLMWITGSNIASFVADGGLQLRGAVHTPPAVIYVGVTVANLAAVVSSGTYALRYRATLELELTRGALFSWQLERLVPTRDAPLLVPSGADPAERARSGSIATAPTVPRSSLVVSPHAESDVPPSERYERISAMGDAAWKCHDRQLDRVVVMKLLPETATAGLRARLEHPAIAPIYDVGTDADGRAFLTMKLVQGKSLEDVLSALAAGDAAIASSYTLGRLLGALGRVCLAVAYAHGQGVHHGALAPSCVMLASFGEVYVEGWTAPSADGSPSSERADVRGLGEILQAILRSAPHAVPELELLVEETTASTPALAPRGPRALYEALEGFLAGERDAELRRRLAAAHRDRALRALERLYSGDASARTAALREVGRAVVLEPSDPQSFELLVRLLTEPPRTPPAEVLGRVRDMGHARGRRSALGAVWFLGFWLTLYPVLAVMIGVENLPAAVLVFIAWAVTVASFVVAARRTTRVPWSMFAIMAATGASTLLSGPFLIVPELASVLAMSFALVVADRWRRVPVFLASLVVLVPTALDATRIVPMYSFVGDVLTLHGALAQGSPLVGTMVNTAVNLLIILFAAADAARFRDTLDAVERRNMVTTWQLSKLVTPLKSLARAPS